MADTEQEGDTGRGRDCLFCGIVAGDIPADIVHSTATTVAFKDIAPAAPLHVLVVPRRHITDAAQVTAADGPVLADMLMAAHAVAEESKRRVEGELASTRRRLRSITRRRIPELDSLLGELELKLDAAELEDHVVGRWAREQLKASDQAAT